MARVTVKITLDRLVTTIVCTLLNKFDCFMVIEGGTGLGKSTLAWHIAKKVWIQFEKLKKLDEERVKYYYEKVLEKKGISLEEFIEYLLKLKEEKAYKFNPSEDMIYTQKDLMKYLSAYRKIGIPDEMVNITFNRDFYSEDQKRIIKMINMYRDHNNLIIACVPSFHVLDNQIKNLCKIRLSVVRRGLAVVQAPNKSIYGKDRWDQATNEKIEREWLTKPGKNPMYSRLSTVRGIVRFPKLSMKEESIYQKIKDDKRSIILKSEMETDKDGKERRKEPIDDLYKRILNGGVKNSQVIDGVALGLGITPDTLRRKLRKMLIEDGKNPTLSEYYYDKKGKSEDKDEKQEVQNLEIDHLIGE